MKIYQQKSPELRAAFQREVDRKAEERRENAVDSKIETIIYEFQEFKNQLKGSVGERIVSEELKKLGNEWGMFKNALIPGSSGKLTEIDRLVIGPGGIFAIEVKNWRGSYSAYRDNWKRRDGQNWIAISNSPTSQNVYHRESFERWLYKQFESGPYPKIHAPVVFPSARWIGVTDCSVPVLRNPKELLNLIAESKTHLSEEQCQDIINRVANCKIERTSPEKPIFKKTRSADLKEVEVVEPLQSKESVQIHNLRSAEINSDPEEKTGNSSNSREKGGKRQGDWKEYLRKKSIEYEKKTAKNREAARESRKERERKERERIAEFDKRRHEERQRIIAHFAQRDKDFKESLSKLSYNRHQKKPPTQ
ncbi:MAG TPA: hypothetical protein DD761_03495 [Cyanobacteria bacterium UBA11691]|nr:hypothetical protein [Cyanobacteria bacterium UBA11691]